MEIPRTDFPRTGKNDINLHADIIENGLNYSNQGS